MINNQKYLEYCRRYKRVRDIVDGQFRLKQVDLSRLSLTGTLDYSNVDYSKVGYLRQINPADRSDYNIHKNKSYIEGAVLFNATARTLSGLMGLLFRSNPVWPDLSASMSYLLDDADGAGLSLDHHAQSTSWNVVTVGRHGLLADIPRNETGEAVTVDRVKRGFRATIKQYAAENIIDYNESVVDGAKVLDFVVLREFKTIWKPNGIDREQEACFRVYRLKDGAVTVQMYDKGMNSEGEEVSVTGGGSQKLERIPFVFVGSVNNSPDYDPLPLEPLTDTNLGHYQESANLRESAWATTSAQPYIADDKYMQWKSRDENIDSDIDIGSNSCHILGSGGTLAFAQPSPNTLSSALMEKDEMRMVALGAQLITPAGQAETAEAVRIKHGSDISVLESISVNVADAYRVMIEACHILMGENFSDLTVSLNREFFDSKLTAQEITAIVGAWQAGAISEIEKSRSLQRGKVIDAETDLEAMHEEIANEQVPAPQFDEVTPSTAITTNDEQ